MAPEFLSEEQWIKFWDHMGYFADPGHPAESLLMNGGKYSGPPVIWFDAAAYSEVEAALMLEFLEEREFIREYLDEALEAAGS